MTWYGGDYARKPGIDVCAFHTGLESRLRRPTFKCRNCVLSFTSWMRRDRHERASCRWRRFDEEVNPALPYFKPEPKVIPSALELSKTLHEPGPETKKKPRCVEGSFSTDNGGNLKQHMFTQKGEKLFSCPHCGYKCTRNSHLQQHLRTHTGEKPFGCELCEYKSARKGDLVRHMLTHSCHKAYQCSECAYATAIRSSLQRHVRAIHTKEYRYACSECEYTCVECGNLKTHMTTHTGVRKYACPKCPFSCNWPCRLKKHLQVKHAAEASQ